MKLAIYGSKRQDAYLEQIERFLTGLSSRGDEVVMHMKLYNYLSHHIPKALACVTRVTDTPSFEADFAVSIGGDGSFLRTAAWVGPKGIPVIGVNTGHLGFLASVDISELEGVADMLESGEWVIENRSVIEVVSPEIHGWPFAVNEVTIMKADGGSIVTVRASIDGVHLADYRADGLIVATPTGSTAYNLSVGGPIVQPTAPVFVLSPIAAHSLTMRPLVVNDRSSLEFECEGRVPTFRLIVDGRTIVLPLGERVVLRRADFDVKVLRTAGHGFADTLRNKLMWSV